VIIDFRARLPYKSMARVHMFNRRPKEFDPVTVNGLLLNLPYYRSYEELSMDAFLEEMDEARIDMVVVTGRVAPEPYRGVDDDDIAELVEQYPDRFVGIGAVDPHDPGCLDQIDALADRGFKGIMTNSGWYEPPMYDDDERMFPLYERCIERNLILSTTGSIFVGPDLTYAHPVHLQRAALRYPELPFVMGHASWPYTQLLCGVAFQCSNVYIMPDIYGNVPNTPGIEVYAQAANYYLSHRLLFGSAYPVRALGESVANFAALPFATDEIRDRCLGGNAARLLGLDPSFSRFGS
jgi:uncharacterized protein